MSIAEQTSASLRADAAVTSTVLVSIVIPCLNEAENIEECVTRARTVLGEHAIPGEVIVADNDSEDDCAALATAAGARVVHEPRRGYGSAYLAGFAAARGKLHRHGRRRPHLRLRRHPALPGRARGRRRPRHGRPHGQHPAGRHALAAPLRRQPGALGHPQPLLPHRRARRPLRHARLPPRRAAARSTCAAPAWSSPPRWSSARRRRSSRSASSRSSTTRAAASPSSRASATAGGTCASCSSTRRRTSSSSPGRSWRSSGR